MRVGLFEGGDRGCGVAEDALGFTEVAQAADAIGVPGWQRLCVDIGRAGKERQRCSCVAGGLERRGEDVQGVRDGPKNVSRIARARLAYSTAAVASPL